MSPAATRAAEFWGGACPTPKSTSSYTGIYTTNADASAANLPLNAISAGARFVANVQLGTWPAKPAKQLGTSIYPMN